MYLWVGQAQANWITSIQLYGEETLQGEISSGKRPSFAAISRVQVPLRYMSPSLSNIVDRIELLQVTQIYFVKKSGKLKEN